MQLLQAATSLSSRLFPRQLDDTFWLTPFQCFQPYTMQVFLWKLYLSSGVNVESVDLLYKSLEIPREQVSEQG